MELTTPPESPMMLQRRCITKRSINVMSTGLTCQGPDDARHIPEVLDELGQIPQTPRLVTSPEDLEALEHEIRQRTDHLGSLLVGYHIPTVCPSVASRNLLLYQSLPSSIPYRYAILWRRKDDPSMGTTASGTVA